MRFRENFSREELHIANSDAIKIASEASVNNVRIREGRERKEGRVRALVGARACTVHKGAR